MNGTDGKENSMSQSNIMDRSALGKAVDGRSDDEINQALAGKYDQTCAEVFEGMKKHFLPEKAGDQTAVIQYNVKAPDAVHTYQVKVEAAQCQVSKGTTDPARVTLTLAFPDFLRLVSGKLNAVQAYFTGRLKVSGDAMFAQSMQGWFKQTE
jgi:putative sterol carrier protein